MRKHQVSDVQVFQPCTHSNRHGATLIAAMVCIMVVSVILASLLKLAASHRRQMRTEERRLQTVWLVDSSLERAASRLKTSPDYAGETWRIPAAGLGGRHSGLVTISVETLDSDADHRIVSVEARYPANTKLFIKSSKKMTLPMALPAKE